MTARKQNLIRQIEAAFDGVVLGSGIGLREGQGLDDYADDKTLSAYRELDEKQEINYPAVMKKLLEVGYTGFVGQEFIPTRDPLAGLKQAVAACDV